MSIVPTAPLENEKPGLVCNGSLAEQLATKKSETTPKRHLDVHVTNL